MPFWEGFEKASAPSSLPSPMSFWHDLFLGAAQNFLLQPPSSQHYSRIGHRYKTSSFATHDSFPNKFHEAASDHLSESDHFTDESRFPVTTLHPSQKDRPESRLQSGSQPYLSRLTFRWQHLFLAAMLTIPPS
jgi:hypothetical protein